MYSVRSPAEDCHCLVGSFRPIGFSRIVLPTAPDIYHVEKNNIVHLPCELFRFDVRRWHAYEVLIRPPLRCKQVGHAQAFKLTVRPDWVFLSRYAASSEFVGAVVQFLLEQMGVLLVDVLRQHEGEASEDSLAFGQGNSSKAAQRWAAFPFTPRNRARSNSDAQHTPADGSDGCNEAAKIA